MSYKNPKDKASLAECLNQLESELRELDGQSPQNLRCVLDFLQGKDEELLLELFELSAQPDYSQAHRFLSLLWSYRSQGNDAAIPDDTRRQALDTITHVSQIIVNSWPSLTPKKMSRLGLLIRDAAAIARSED